MNTSGECYPGGIFLYPNIMNDNDKNNWDELDWFEYQDSGECECLELNIDDMTCNKCGKQW